MIQVKLFSKGKGERNEDSYGYNDSTFVIADGATDKSGFEYEGKKGGEILSGYIVDICLKSSKNGSELAQEITEEVRKLYADINPQALDDGFYRFKSSLICARVQEGILRVTQIGDSTFRINGTDIYENNKIIDTLTANARSQYIQQTGDIKNSRNFIIPLLQHQHTYLNNINSPLGFGVIDGTEINDIYIKQYSFDLVGVSTLELYTDGYMKPAHEVSIESREKAYEYVEAIDPYKRKEFKSTKKSDDRTVMIISF